MRKISRLYHIIIVIILFVSLMMPTFTMPSIAASSNKASILNKLGILSNIQDYELSAGLNRLVGLTMVLKAYGYTEADSNKASSQTPFYDLRGSYKWGIGWVNIGLEKSITIGTANNYFSPGAVLTKKEFVAFALRLLNYGVGESFTDCDKLALEAGLIDAKSELNDSYFTKGDAVEVIYAALYAKLKNEGNKTLIERMIEDGIISKEAAVEQGIQGANTYKIDAVQPLSNTYLMINLEEPVEAVQVTDFNLVDDEGEEVEIVSANLYNKNKTVLLKSESQEEGILHTIRIRQKEFSFTSLEDDDRTPRLIDVDVISNTSIRLIFDEPMSEKALDEDYYSINNLTVKSAEYESRKIQVVDDTDEDTTYAYEVLEEDEDTTNSEVEDAYELLLTKIILTTSKQTENRSYHVTVSSLTDLSNNRINSGYNDEYFSGGDDDSDRPRLEDATALSNTKVKLEFSEKLDEGTAEDIDNYGISGLTIKRAILDSNDNTVVYLLTSEQKDGKKYVAHVYEVEDLQGKTIHTSYDSETFYGEGKDETSPRLIGANAISNTKVEVIFSEPISHTTALMEYAYYLGEELGYAMDVEIDTSDADGTTWILTTRPQLEQEYTLTVKGLKDLEGNMINNNYTQKSFEGTLN